MTQRTKTMRPHHALVVGFAGVAKPSEWPRVLLPALDVQSPCMADLGSGSSSIVLNLKLREGDVLYLQPPDAPHGERVVATSHDGEKANLQLFCGPIEEIAEYLSSLSANSVKKALGAIELGLLDNASEYCRRAIASRQDCADARALLWFCETLRRPIDDDEPGFERHLRLTFQERHRELGTIEEKVRSLAYSRGTYFIYRENLPSQVSIIEGQSDFDRPPRVIREPASSFPPIRLDTGVHAEFSPKVKGVPNGRVNAILYGAWNCLKDRLEDDSITVLARNLWRAVTQLVIAGKFPVQRWWIDAARLILWGNAIEARNAGKHKTSIDLFLASAHAATVLIEKVKFAVRKKKVKAEEPTNYFQRAQCYEAAGSRYSEKMKDDARLGLSLPRGIRVNEFIHETGCANAHRMLARAALLEEGWSDAEAEFTKAKTLFERHKENLPGRKFVHERLGECYYSLGRLKGNYAFIRECQRLFESLLVDNPTFYRAYLRLGDCALEMGNRDEAIKCFNSYVRQRPNDYVGYDRLRVFYRRTGDIQREGEVIAQRLAMARERNDRAIVASYEELLGDWKDRNAAALASHSSGKKQVKDKEVLSTDLVQQFKDEIKLAKSLEEIELVAEEPEMSSA